jgi:phosphoglycolate phosphatase
MHKILILWDIDGTILHSGGAGMHSLQLALKEVFGSDASIADIDFAGRTDPWIIGQVFARAGIEDSPGNRASYIDGYIGLLPSVLRLKQASVLPGLRPLLEEAAAHPHVAQGLLTGNLRRGAETKLGYHGLWHHFAVGAFADDSAVRNELGPHALRRARAHWAHEFPVGRVWIVGDTPHDIACARAVGARVLAVATGSSSVADLAAHAPDAVLRDLSDPAPFWAALGA